jgi:hypothetical protein
MIAKVQFNLVEPSAGIIPGGCVIRDESCLARFGLAADAGPTVKKLVSAARVGRHASRAEARIV